MAIYAVDFDGTLAVTRFPEIVEPKRKVVAAATLVLAALGVLACVAFAKAGNDMID